MRIGAHVSAVGGVWNAPANAAKQKLDTFQIFSRPPQGGPAPKIGDEEVKKFKTEMEKNGFEDFVIHAPYYTNLGSADNRIYYGTISVLRQELERGSMLGASYVMFHPGSFAALGQKKGMKQAIEGIKKFLDGYKGQTQLLLEISAGAGSICGDTFEELAEMLQGNEKYLGKSLGGICFDTQHAFASGYDLRTEGSVKKVFTQFDKIIGLEYLKLIHANDSKVDLGKRSDRHEHIGDGKIGMEGFTALAKFTTSQVGNKQVGNKRRTLSLPNLKNLAWILETKDEKRKQDVQILREIQAEYQSNS